MQTVMNDPILSLFLIVCALAVGAIGIIGWVYTTRLRIQHGYPLETSWGRAIHPVRPDAQFQERLTQLTAENTELKMAVADLEGRLRNLERIATDPVERLKRDIDQLN